MVGIVTAVGGGTIRGLVLGITPVFWIEDHSYLVAAIAAGLVTGVGGGVIRDILAGQTPLILRSDIYATAALAGVVVYVAAVEVMPEPLAAVLGGGAILLRRLGALARGWSLPAFRRARTRTA